MPRFAFVSSLFVLFVYFSASTKGAITTLNFFHDNDFFSCPTGAPAHTMAIVDDGICRLLLPAIPSLGTEACYYNTVSSSFTGDKSGETYTFKSLILVDRCDCEFIAGRTGHRYYNRTCTIAHVVSACNSFRNSKKVRTFWPAYFEDTALKFWGIDVDYIQEFTLY